MEFKYLSICPKKPDGSHMSSGFSLKRHFHREANRGLLAGVRQRIFSNV